MKKAHKNKKKAGDENNRLTQRILFFYQKSMHFELTQDSNTAYL